jgi:predicted amidohydrolase YtcJ
MNTRPVTIYRARSIRTVDPSRPLAEAVAVRDGRILGVGTLEELGVWGPTTVNDTFADSVLVPGFVEAHSHVLEGALWAFEYVGFFDRVGADGVLRPGCKSIAAVLDRLRQLVADAPGATDPLIVWGLDPIYFPDEERLVARHLDTVSESRPIFVFHASGHLATVNTALMQREGFADGIDVEGVPLDVDGRPIGELQEPAAYSLAREAVRNIFTALSEPSAIARFGQSAQLSGSTTVTELGTTRLDLDGTLAKWQRAVDNATFPARVSIFYNPGAVQSTPDEIAASVVELGRQSSDRLHVGHVKLVLDGSIQGFTARLNWPGYLNGATGIWLYDPDRFRALVMAFHRAGITIHTHCNGDQAVDLFVEAVTAADRAHPWRGHRHTVQHCQLTTPAQYQRMAELGMCANIFANHLWFWGDQHHDITVGPDRAKRMDACGTAERLGVSFSIHSDASVTPLGQLHTMWCAVNRVTPSGRILGENERITAASALQAVTLGAAHQLQLDDRIGSISPGKFADFTALSDDPTVVEPMAIRDIGVNGTVVGGRDFVS